MLRQTQTQWYGVHSDGITGAVVLSIEETVGRLQILYCGAKVSLKHLCQWDVCSLDGVPLVLTTKNDRRSPFKRAHTTEARLSNLYGICNTEVAERRSRAVRKNEEHIKPKEYFQCFGIGIFSSLMPYHCLKAGFGKSGWRHPEWHQ